MPTLNQTAATSPRYVVMTAPVRRSARVRYTRVAVVEVQPGFSGTPTAIDMRAAGVSRIVYDRAASGDVCDALASAEAVRSRCEGRAN